MKVLYLLAISIFIFCCKEIWAQHNAHEGGQDRKFNYRYSSQDYSHPDNYHHYSAEKNILLPKSKTEYEFQTVRTKTAERIKKIPIKPRNMPTQYYFVTTNTTTFSLPRKSHQSATQAYHPHGNTSRSAICIKCPSEKIIIARKGLDGVLLEPPKLMSCHNKASLKDMYQIHTLFGSSFKFLLPHGTHSIHTKILNKQTKKYVQICTLRYQVIVQRCEQFVPQNHNIKTDCDIGNIWGSRCHFICKSGYLSHRRPIVCGDSLKWEGSEPECLPHSSFFNRALQLEEKPCSFLKAPDNGKFACEYPKGLDNNSYENALKTPEGTICLIICDDFYEIPSYLEFYNAFVCKNGEWSQSTQDLCHPRNFYIPNKFNRTYKIY